MGWTETAGRFGKYWGLPPARTVNVHRKTPLPFQDVSKNSGCIKTRALSQLDGAGSHASRCSRAPAHVRPEHPQPHALPARPQPEPNLAGTRPSPARQAARCSGTAPARCAGPPRSGLGFSFFPKLFPTRPFQQQRDGQDPECSALPRYLMKTQFEPAFFNDSL